MGRTESKMDAATIKAIEKGQCSLFLGAGASRAAGGPSTQQLVKMIAPTGLSGRLGLNRAAELFLEAPNSAPVLRDICKRLEDLDPGPEHLALTRYEWRAIVTTNYDKLIEKAYDNARLALQKPSLIITEEDLFRVDDQDALALPVIKLHGCVTRAEKIVMSWRDIYNAKRDRRLLFTYVESLHILGPVIYIGYSMSDIHILEMLYDLNIRLGRLCQPVYFIAKENKRLAPYARQWFTRSLHGVYVNYGFDGFVKDLTEHVRPASGPSNIVRALAPCTARGFGGAASLTVQIIEEDSEWMAQITYKISNDEGYAGVIFEANGAPVDLSHFKQVTFQLWVEKVSGRQNPRVDALKLESTNQTYPFYYDISQMHELQWNNCRVPIEAYRNNVDLSKIERIVFADNGHRAKLNETYTMKLRRVNFQ